jgi:flagellar biosynthesis anti-sigma factor FlgM
MGNIPPITGTTKATNVAPSQTAPREAAPTPQGAEDRVEISDVAQSLSTMELDSNIRVDKVLAIREAIQNGTYETEEKIEATVERLLDVLRDKD